MMRPTWCGYSHATTQATMTQKAPQATYRQITTHYLDKDYETLTVGHFRD